MKLYIAGVSHFDPICRTKLVDWFKSIKSENIGKPDFLAPEWDQDIFYKVIEQRKYFNQLIKNEWTSLSDDEINDIVMSLGYEGDSHLGVFGEINLLWLDHSRNDVSQDAIDNYALFRFKTIKSSGIREPDSSNFSNRVSSFFRQVEDDTITPTDRDRRFANTIIDYVNENNSTWGIVVVGSNHAAKNEGMMRYFLEQEGYDCIVKVLY